MKIYKSENQEDIVDSIIQMLEKETGNKVFTVRILNKLEEELETIIVFEDKSVLTALVSVETIDGKLACRMRGNYI